MQLQWGEKKYSHQFQNKRKSKMGQINRHTLTVCILTEHTGIRVKGHRQSWHTKAEHI